MDKLPDIPWTNTGRPFDYPNKPYAGYQEWHDVIMLHWKADTALIRKMVPQELELDTFNGNAWISIIPFTVRNLHPRGLPKIKALSHFHEINVRTYVTYKGIPGIYFFSLEASKQMPVIAARLTTGLPYVKSDIWREEGMYSGSSQKYGFQFYINYKLGDPLINKDNLDTWLADRFRLYVKTSGHISAIDIHHHPWPLVKLVNRYIKLNYMVGGITLSKQSPDLLHFSHGVKVATWRKKRA